jgi:hypothetical protein
VDSQNAIVSSPLLDPNHSIGQKPVMGMDQIETANKVFDFKNAVNEGTTHVVDIVHKVIEGQVCAAMIVDAIYAIVTSLARHSPRENVYLVAFSYKSRSQFCHMDSNTTDRNRMK